MNEIDLDKSGTVDFFEFLSVARLVTQQKGKSAIFKKKRLTALQKSTQASSKICVIQ
ncbi:glutamic acid-rich isoform X2 [Paramuricea clavata]|uniref:Glutamic acid-rich isoform X2 n=1 Tax=Paramuricea clavata TaxID=317549 RepID=A0A6S7HAE2_PARCT|nr:glutamic acid-rich isoform X2 [Paramuricea clavata]